MKLSFDSVSKFFQKLIWPSSSIAGLEIKDAAVRIVKFENGELKKAAVLLEPGVIESGRIVDRARLLESMKKLHSQFERRNVKVPAIVVVPSSNVYAQVFTAPSLQGEKLEEAAKLNLASISPLDLKAAYADWQQVGVQEREGKFELLGAFASSVVIDEYASVLNESGFVPVAIEFPGLSIARTIKNFAADIDIEKPHVVLNVSSDGVDFMVLRRGNLYFDYFTPWKLIQEDGRLSREISFSDFKATIIREIKKVAAFYGSHWEGKLNKIILVTQALNAEIATFIKENFDFEVVDLRLNQYTDLPSSWFGVLGSALRGRMPRSEDNYVSLMAIGTEEEYLRSRIQLFITSWKDIVFVTLGFIAAIFILTDSFLYQTADRLALQLNEISQGPEAGEVVRLQEEARKFNELVAKSEIAKQQSPSWSPLFVKLNSLLNKDISLTRVFIDASRSSALLSGNAKDEATAVNFKNALAQEGFKSVSLPLSNIVLNPNRTVSFMLTFKL
jgi:hypothetical protein